LRWTLSSLQHNERRTFFVGRQNELANEIMMRPASVLLAGLLMLVPSFAPIWAANGVIPAERREVAPTFEAYAQVEPIRTLTVSAPMAGVLSQLKAVPGDTVKTGALLVRIGGPQAAAALESAQAQVVRARAALKLADRTLDIARAKQREHLATRQAVYGAKAALADAKAQMQSAQTRLNALRTSTTIRAPTDATVLSVLASNGEYVTEGAALLGCTTVATQQRSAWV
jgi:multidrug efflux pump subunit AcrA (membrane-fusion protein)